MAGRGDMVPPVWCQCAPTYSIATVCLLREPWTLIRLPSGLNGRSEEHTSELQSLMRISYAVFCLKKTIKDTDYPTTATSTPTSARHVIPLIYRVTFKFYLISHTT